MTDDWDEVANREPSQAQLLERALEQAKGTSDGEIDPEHPDCPLCGAAAGQRVTLINAIAGMRDLCPTCRESIGTNAEEELMRGIRDIR